MRLGLALGLTVSQVRALPYPEFKKWQLFYQLEPWGWQNLEYYAAILYCMIYNTNRGDKKAKKPSDFFRDMEALLLEQNSEPESEIEEQMKDMTPDERRAFLLSQIRKDFGVT